MRVLLSAWGSRGNVEPMVGLELVVAKSEAITAVTEEYGAPVATAVVSAGGWR